MDICSVCSARSSTLRCKARSEIVNPVLDVADGESETVIITEDNFEELQNLCKELGSGVLTKNFARFVARPGVARLISNF